MVPFFPDEDADGYGAALVDTRLEDFVSYACPGARMEGWAENSLDCDDYDDQINPDATEVWYDGIDQNCDGNDTDQDGDGFVHMDYNGDDCDDEDETVDNEACKLSQIAISSATACGIWGDGSFTCWGTRDMPPLKNPPDAKAAVSIGVDYNNACVVNEVGSVVCGGEDNSIQTDAPEGEEFISVSVGEIDACALREDGSIQCWGVSEPRFPASSGFRQVEVGLHCTCALNDQGLAICWGEPGTCADEVQSIPFLDIGVGSHAACGLSEEASKIFCWGTGTPALFNEKPKGGLYRDLDVGGNSACALYSDGRPVCWGEIQGPNDEISETAYSWIVVGPYHACARQEEGGQIDCWGPCGGGVEEVCKIPDWNSE
jgi:hypothetical protein